MRRFRLKKGSVTDCFLKPVKHGDIYNQDYFLDKGGNLIQEGVFWQEVLESDNDRYIKLRDEILNAPTPKPLHKDTDLGYYAGLAMQGLLANPSEVISNLTDPQKAQYALIMAENLIKQLDEQGHA